MRTRQEQLDEFNKGLAEREIANLEARREDNELDFHRERVDAPECDGVGVHLHRPHDDKVGPYRVGAAAGVVLGTAVAFKLTELSVHGSRVTVSQIVDPTAPQIAPVASDGVSTLGLTLVVAGVVVGVGKIVEAAFSSVERRRFLDNADHWFRKIVLFGALPAAIIVLARLAKGDLAEWFLILEGFGWAGLELAFVAIAALGWVGSSRFAWCRKYVSEDTRLREEIESLRHSVSQRGAEGNSRVSGTPVVA